MLTGPEIKRLVNLGAIEIDPFDEQHLNPNSYDVRLDGVIKEVCPGEEGPAKTSAAISQVVYDNGYVLQPGRLYLASTIERTSTPEHVPCIHGKSSHARRGLQIHQTAGFGDHGFCGTWTLEITCVLPFRVYPGMRIAQISFTPIVGRPSPYQGRYQHQSGATLSRSHLGD